MNTKQLIKELKFQTARSAGSGGQHVNKTETKVELFFNIETSKVLSEDDKLILKQKLKNRISKDSVLHMSCQAKRSQVWNKKIVIQKFLDTIEKALEPEKERIPTKPTKAMVEKRLKNKRQNSDVKAMRKKLNTWDI